MESNLNNLKRILDNTVYKNANFSKFSKAKVLQKIDKTEKNNMFEFVKPMISYVVLILISISIGSYSYIQMTDKGSISQKEIISEDENIRSSNSIKVEADEKEDGEDSELVVVENNNKSYPYIIFNNFYYKKIDEKILESQLNEIIGEVKRIGEWNSKKSGDSNEIPPGPIYSVIGYDSTQYIAGKGVVYEDNKNKPGYILFKKEEPLEQTDVGGILNAKSDPDETSIAYTNVKKLVPNLLGFQALEDIYTLSLVSYLNDNGPGVELIYTEINGDGGLFINEYQSESPPLNSRLTESFESEEEWMRPVVMETFSDKGIEWEYFEDENHDDFFLLGKKGDFYYEITYQGNYSLEKLKEYIRYFN